MLYLRIARLLQIQKEKWWREREREEGERMGRGRKEKGKGKIKKERESRAACKNAFSLEVCLFSSRIPIVECPPKT